MNEFQIGNPLEEKVCHGFWQSTVITYNHKDIIIIVTSLVISFLLILLAMLL
jgi:hypothetical protein